MSIGTDAGTGEAQPPGITVTGSGRATDVPDVFVLVVGAEASSEQPAEALARAGGSLERIRAAALGLGVPERQLTTQNLVLRQGYDREGQPRGLVCELALTIRSTDVARAGELVSACVEAGGAEARLQSAGFEHSDPSGLLVAARDSAFADARARAEQLAARAGRELGPVVRVVEEEPAWAPLHRGKVMALSAPPVDAGTLDAAATVTVTWNWASESRAS